MKIFRLSGANFPSWPTGSLPHGRLRYWAGTLGRFGSVQLLVQIIMAVCGFLIVRSLSKPEYAIFVVSNTMLGTMTVLSDAGATIGLTAIGGKHWQDRRRLGEILNATLAIRRNLVTAAVGIGTPLLVWLLRRNGSTLGYAVLMAVVTLAGLYFQVGLSVYRVVMQLHSRLGLLQRTDLLLAALRVVMVGGFALWFLNAALAIGAMSLCLLVQWWQMRNWAFEDADATAAIRPEDRLFIYAKVRQVIPDTLFYCFQGQLWVFIISLFGSKGEMADVGALGRIAVVFNVVFIVLNNAVVPAFSRCQNAGTLWRRYVQIVAGFAVLGAALIGLSWLLPGPLLWIIGTKYAHLQYELVLSTVLTVVTGISTLMWTLNAAKGWTNYLWVDIPLRLMLQASLYAVFDLSTIRGVLYFSLLSCLSPLLVTAWLAQRGLRIELASQSAGDGSSAARRPG